MAAAKSSMRAIEFLAKKQNSKDFKFFWWYTSWKKIICIGVLFLNDCILSILKSIELGFKNFIH